MFNFKLINKISSLIIYIIFLFLIAEISAFFALKIYRSLRVDLLDTAFTEKSILSELKRIQKNANYSAHRWYYNETNFSGNHAITDSYGFRINEATLDQRKKIAMFGGSTMFSVLTNQEGTIPDQIQSAKYQVLNFGMGGYSTSVEIMAFIESLRAYPDIKIAFFYDGVNELGRAMEINNSNQSEFKIGAPFNDGVKLGLKNSSPFTISLENSNLFYLAKKFIKFNQDLKIDNKFLINSIVNRYYENLKIIQSICFAYEVKCLFSWQPSIYTINSETLTEREKIIFNASYAKELYKKLTLAIFKDERAINYKLIDLTKSLDKKSTRIFYDWHHLNAEGNKLVAKKISEILKKIN